VETSYQLVGAGEKFGRSGRVGGFLG
jgi:hypothetical protein